jgi:hypothetical protein
MKVIGGQINILVGPFVQVILIQKKVMMMDLK